MPFVWLTQFGLKADNPHSPNHNSVKSEQKRHDTIALPRSNKTLYCSLYIPGYHTNQGCRLFAVVAMVLKKLGAPAKKYFLLFYMFTFVWKSLSIQTILFCKWQANNLSAWRDSLVSDLIHLCAESPLSHTTAETGRTSIMCTRWRVFWEKNLFKRCI